MSLVQEIRGRLSHVVGPVLGVCMVGYFGFHVVHGDRGLIAWWSIKHRVAQAKEALAVATAERKKVGNRVRLLNPGSLDADMLEERARLMLNYGHADEIVIFDEEKRRK